MERLLFNHFHFMNSEKTLEDPRQKLAPYISKQRTFLCGGKTSCKKEYDERFELLVRHDGYGCRIKKVVCLFTCRKFHQLQVMAVISARR